jgi:hypothetical protein
MTASSRPVPWVVPSLALLAAATLLLSAPLAAQGPPASSATPTLSTPEEREAFLSGARVVRTRPASKGITNTLRVTLSDGVVTHDASVQSIDESRAVFESARGTELNFKDSWRFNVAAYKIDRLLDLGMIPPSVERRFNAKVSSFTWWVDDVLMDEQERYQKKRRAPSIQDWNQQMWVTRLFDQLIANVDRNLGNLLIDKSWNIWLIDHSRAFRLNAELRSPENLSRVDRSLLNRLRQLDRESLRSATSGYLTGQEIDALLSRRDHIVAHFENGGPQLVFDRRARCC